MISCARRRGQHRHTHTHTICWPGQSGAESVVNAQLINMSLGPCIDASMKFSFSRRLLGKHKFDYVANSIYHAPSHASAWQGRLTQCIWEPTRCAHTHTHTPVRTETEQTAYVSSLQKFAASSSSNNNNDLDALKMRANLENFVLTSCFAFTRFSATIFTVYTSNGKSGKKVL